MYYLNYSCIYSNNFKSDLEVARIKVDTLQLKKNIAESKVLHHLFSAFLSLSYDKASPYQLTSVGPLVG